jgi:hypothetical protein
MIKKLRNEQLTGSNSSKMGLWAANNFTMINNSVPTLLNTVNMAHKVGGWVGRTTAALLGAVAHSGCLAHSCCLAHPDCLAHLLFLAQSDYLAHQDVPAMFARL